MPFSDELSAKQHINLSDLAYDVLWQDILAFGLRNTEEKPTGENYDKPRIPSGFLNRIFINYYKNANASVMLKARIFNTEIEESLDGIDFPEKRKVIQQILSKRLDKMKKIQEKRLDAYSSERTQIQFKYTLNKQVFEYLCNSEKGECKEDACYRSSNCKRSIRGKYLKAVLEEYARLSYIEREKIYFAETISEVKEAIKANEELKIILNRGTVFKIFPYKVLQDPYNTANYLVGVGGRISIENEILSTTSLSFRLTNIREIHNLGRVFTPQALIDDLKRELKKNGASFLAGKSNTIKVALTQEGKRKYRTIRHLRPDYIKCDGSEYTFNCTEHQAFVYFSRFGADAKVLFPESLKQKIYAFYKSGLAVYSKKD